MHGALASGVPCAAKSRRSHRLSSLCYGQDIGHCGQTPVGVKKYHRNVIGLWNSVIGQCGQTPGGVMHCHHKSWQVMEESMAYGNTRRSHSLSWQVRQLSRRSHSLSSHCDRTVIALSWTCHALLMHLSCTCNGLVCGQSKTCHALLMEHTTAKRHLSLYCHALVIALSSA